MKTASQTSVVITPAIVVILLVSADVLFIGRTGKKVPLLSNLRVDIVLIGAKIVDSVIHYLLGRSL
jgi:hypothetical protein